MIRRNKTVWLAVLAAYLALAAGAWAAESHPAAETTNQQGADQEGKKANKQETLVRLSKQDDVWIDRKQKTVVVGGQVCLREGMLEMFACPRHTKEHESIVAVNSRAFIVHAALLAVGARPGKPAQFAPKYVPARGDEIEIRVVWKDAQGKRHEVQAQQWIRKVGTDKALDHPWVFVGSVFWTDPTTGRRYYQAEGGDMICVSNFATAMLDLPIPSSQANDSLLFEAYTQRIPPRGTQVKLLLRPRPRPGGGKPDEKKKR